MVVLSVVLLAGCIPWPGIDTHEHYRARNAEAVQLPVDQESVEQLRTECRDSRFLLKQVSEACERAGIRRDISSGRLELIASPQERLWGTDGPEYGVAQISGSGLTR